MTTNKLPYKAKDLPNIPIDGFELPCLTSSFQNQGLNYFVPKEGATILKNVISIPSNSDVYRAYYQSHPFTVLSDAYAVRWRSLEYLPTKNQYLFMLMCINKVIDLPIYSYKNKLGGWNVVKDKKMQLPQMGKQIDFDFMEKFISYLMDSTVERLQSYLEKENLLSSELLENEVIAINDFTEIKWSEFNLRKLFGKSTRGKRLKSEDRIPGHLPFITAGETSEGVSSYISNTVEVFAKNTTTVDMFGSAKYRNFEYGADDHIAVVHTEKLDKHAAIFITSAIHKAAHNGQFNYGRNFYAKDADELNIMLPVKNGAPDYEYMATVISAVKKIVAKKMERVLTK